MSTDDEKYINFKNHKNRMRVPFVIYADFECFTEPIDTCSLDASKSFTHKYQKHNPSGFCYYVKCFDDEIYKVQLVSYTA